MSTVLRARILTSQSPTQTRYLEDGVLSFDSNGIIEWVQPYSGQPFDHDLRPKLLVPGFVDTHIHFPQTRIVGSATGPLLEWLNTSTFPEEARFACDTHAKQVADHFVRSLAASGTTSSFVYSSVHPSAANALFNALDASGLRAIAGPVLMDEHCPDDLSLSVEPAFDGLAQLKERWHGHDDRLQLAVIPRFALCCSPNMLQRAADFAQSHNLWVSTHLSENPIECQIATERFKAPDYLAVYERFGLVHKKSIYAHCIHLSESEWTRFAQSKAVVAHCPDSNFFLGSGRMPINEVISRQIPMGIGTDIAAGRSFRVPRILSSAYDNGLCVNTTLSPAQLLWWGTRGGALALGLSHVGMLNSGLEADMACFALPPWVESEDQVLAALLFNHDAPPPERTWVRGRLVWGDPL